MANRKIGIFKRINEVMREVGYVEKTGEIKGKFRYKYAGEAHLIEALRPAMVKHGLMLSCSGMEVICNEVIETGRGPRFRFLARFDWRWHDVDGNELLVSSFGESFGNDDKGVYKAMTGGLKYALRQTMLIETGDDPDKYQDESFDSAERQKLRQQADEVANVRKQIVSLFHKVSGLRMGEWLQRDVQSGDDMTLEEWVKYRDYLSGCLTREQSKLLHASMPQAEDKVALKKHFGIDSIKLLRSSQLQAALEFINGDGWSSAKEDV